VIIVMKTTLSKYDELSFKVNCLKSRRNLLDNRIRDMEEKIRFLYYGSRSPGGGDKK